MVIGMKEKNMAAKCEYEGINMAYKCNIFEAANLITLSCSNVISLCYYTVM